MSLVIITLALLAVTFASFIYGAIGLSKYAFRLGPGPGIMTLLLPPYTFYFAFYKLNQEGKERPTAMWMFGLLASALLIGIFWVPLSAAATGDLSKLSANKPAEQQQVVVAPLVASPPRPEPVNNAPAAGTTTGTTGETAAGTAGGAELAPAQGATAAAPPAETPPAP